MFFSIKVIKVLIVIFFTQLSKRKEYYMLIINYLERYYIPICL